MMVDPSPPTETLAGSNEEIATKRRRIGLPQKEKVTRTVTKDPSRGGCEGFPEWLRKFILDRFDHDGGIVKASIASVYRWKTRSSRYVKTRNEKQGDLTGSVRKNNHFRKQDRSPKYVTLQKPL